MAVIVCAQCGVKNRIDPERMVKGVARCGKCRTTLPTARDGAAEGKPITVSDASFEQEVLGFPNPVLVDCWAPWCGPCRIIAPIMDQLAAESQGRYRIAKLNVDENPGIAAQFKIQSIPTLLIFKNKRLVDRLIGVQPKQAIEARLRAV